MLATWRRIRFHRLRAMSHPMSLHPTGQSRVLSSTSAHMLGCFSRVGLCNSTYYSRPGSPIREVSRQEYFTTSTTWEVLRFCSPAGYKSSSCVSSLSFWLLPRLPVYYKGYWRKQINSQMETVQKVRDGWLLQVNSTFRWCLRPSLISPRSGTLTTKNGMWGKR